LRRSRSSAQRAAALEARGGGTTGSGGSGTGGDPSTTTSTTTTTGTGGGTTTTTGTGGAQGDGNDSFEEAVALEEGGNQDLIDDAQTDADFFKFEGKAGDLYLITASSHPSGTDMDPGYIDTFIELYDTNQKLLATNDDRYPRNNTDSEIVTVLPETGTYYVKLQEWCISPTADANFCDQTYFDALLSFDYVIGAIKLEPGPGQIIEMEPNNSNMTGTPIAYAPTPTAGSYYLTVIEGTLPSANDVDWYSFQIPADLTVGAGTRAKTNLLFPWGATTGNGSNLKIGMVEVVDPVTAAVIGAFDMTNEVENTFERGEINTPVTPGKDYLLKVSYGGTQPSGGGDFYFVYQTLTSGNPLEVQEMANDMLATPEVLTLSAGTVGSYFVEGDIPVGDIDHFQINTLGLPTLSVACSSQRAGSGVRGLTATILKPDGTAIAMGSQKETETASIFLDHIAVGNATDLIVKLEATGAADPTNKGTYYLCGIHAGDVVGP
jgi:hypothetical protein